MNHQTGMFITGCIIGSLIWAYLGLLVDNDNLKIQLKSQECLEIQIEER